MPTPTDPAVLYPDIAACGGLAAALRTEAEGCLRAVPVTSPDSSPLLHASVASTLPHREPLQISASSHERRWSIRGTEAFQSVPLVDGTTDDLAEVARAARAWHDGAAPDDIRRAAPFVHLAGRFEVPDRDPARLTESEWQRMRQEARDLEYTWQETHQALIEAAHAEPALRALFMRAPIWATRAAWTVARARTSRVAGVVAAATARSTCAGTIGCSTEYPYCPTLIGAVGLRKMSPLRLVHVNSERRAASRSWR
ncbi:DUF6193 family natural product biosynthesis protein [Kitasatospora sp. NPDC058218]|uniref:DUF6193 family natural product biosynthesis protein n=1 Tax=Kitasatospora sp. NPDC058218 TaxID=3346385 RepID=UPI0036DB3F83